MARGAILSRGAYRFLSTLTLSVIGKSSSNSNLHLHAVKVCFVTPQLLVNFQSVAAFKTLGKYSVQAVSFKKREENQPVYSEASLAQTRPVSTSTQHRNSASDMAPSDSSTTVEAVVAKVGDIENGQMREVEIEGKKILLVKEDGQFYAVGNKCTHYGAPLSKGVYCKGVVRCPWHGACFNIKTGDIEDFPGLDSLHTFDVTVRGEDVVVTATKAKLENHRRVKAMVKKVADNKQMAVLVGGGPSSLVCAQTLREEGFKGRIVIVSKEPHLPYDRIKLSKALTCKPEDITLRNQEFYDTNGIELMLGKEVTSVTTSNSTVSLNDGQTLGYDYLLLATGGQPRRLPIPGIDLKNVFFLRTIEDANAIGASAKDKNVVIVGSSFIGMEVAAFLADKAHSVHVVDLITVPFQLTLGQRVGAFMQQMHEAKGVKFHFESSVKELRESNGQVKEAVLSNGETLQADVVVMGVGVVPSTEFLKGSGVELTKVGYVPVNKRMETKVPGVYAAGDITEVPLFTEGDKSVNIQHYQMAHKHGRTAALSMAGKPQDIHSVPYFWTVQFGKSIRYCGYGPGYDDVVMHGEMEENKFVAFYTKGNYVVAVASLGWDPIVSQVAELMSKGGRISKDEIKSDPSSSWLPRLCQGVGLALRGRFNLDQDIKTSR